MTYIKTKPDPGKSPQLDAPIIQDNFFTYGNVFSNNHTVMNNFNQGDHEKIILEKQITDPGISTNIDCLYQKDATSNLGTQPQLFFQIPQFLPKTPDNSTNLNLGMQLTYNQVNTVGPVYQSFLPGVIDAIAPTLTGAYLIYMGQQAFVNPITTVILSPIPTLIKCVIVIGIKTALPAVDSLINSFSVAVNNVLHDRFTIEVFPTFSNNNPNFWGYIAIGTV